MKLVYEALIMETVLFSGDDIVCASGEDKNMSKSDRKYAEWEKRQRQEALEEEYDEVDGMEDADF